MVRTKRSGEGVQVFGAVVGAAIGIWGGVFPALVFAVTGAIAGRALWRSIVADIRDDLAQQRLIFRLAGFHCKLQGAITPRHLAATQSLIRRLDLSVSGQREAVASFNQGKAGLDADAVSARLRHHCRTRLHSASLAWLLVRLVRSDVQGLAAESRLQATVARLGLPAVLVRLKKTPAPDAPQSQPAATPSSAWRVLGVAPGTQGAALKKAYRKAMSTHHPDKVAAAGGSAEAIEAAKQESQKIQAAWNKVKRHATR